MWGRWSCGLFQQQHIHKVGFSFFLSGHYRFVDLHLARYQSSLSAYCDVGTDRWHYALEINKSFICCHLSLCNPDLDFLEWKVWASCKCSGRWMKKHFSLRKTILKACFDSISLSVTTFCTLNARIFSVLDHGLQFRRHTYALQLE